MSKWNLDRIPDGEKANIKQMSEQDQYIDLITLFYDWGVIPKSACHSCVISEIKDWVSYYLEVYSSDG